jgi:predicted phage tail protein
MGTSGNQLLASLPVSGIGFVLLVYGRKQARLPQLVTGLALMVFPYFVPSALVTLAVAGGLLLALGVLVRLGW